jgi:hypothetical protein
MKQGSKFILLLTLRWYKHIGLWEKELWMNNKVMKLRLNMEMPF